MTAEPACRQAAFISPVTRPVSAEGDPAVYFRREFHVADGLRKAVLRITAIGLVEPYVNGDRVGDEVLEPGWTSYRHRLVVRSHDITRHLRPGANVVGAIVGDGWALGRLGYEAISRRRIFADRPALYAQLQLDYRDHSEIICSDESFRAGEGAVRENSIYDGETIDARLEPHGWSLQGFDDSRWSAVDAVDWDHQALVEPIAPPIRRIEELTPLDIRVSPAGRTIVDFGQNISGWVRITASGPAGHVITVRHGEVLVHGELDFTTLRTARATDRFVLEGSGIERFEPRFTFHGFRYAQIDGFPGDLTADDIRAVVVHSDMTRTGWFETTNELINRLHQNVIWSMRDNFVGIPTDCPQRDERLGWTGDINAFASTAAFLYDVRGVLGSWLRDLAAEQAEKGVVPYVVPDIHNSGDAPTALWSDVAVSLPWTLYREYGDEDILRRNYDSMVAFTRSVEALLDEDGVWSSGFQFGDWLDPDAPMGNPMGGKTDAHLVASAYFGKVSREMAETARLLGRGEDAEHFAALAERVRTAFRAEYVSANGRVVNETATAYALAIVFDLLSPSQLANAGERLARIVREAGFRISTGFAGTLHLLHALSSTGHLKEAYRLLLRTQPPSFLYPVTMGATTVWERWDSILPDGTINPSGMTSLNHYALGAVADWLHRVVGGITPDQPGYRTMTIAPRPGGGLTHASTGLNTVHGRVEVTWRIDDARLLVEVTIPEGTQATVALPQHPDGAVVPITAGAHRWEYEIAALGQRELGLDSTIGELATDEAVWKGIQQAFGRHLPHVPLDYLIEQASAMPLTAVLENLPNVTGELRDELRRACASVSASR